MKHDLLHIQGKPYVLVPMHEYRQMVSQAPDGAAAQALPDDILNQLTARQDSAIKILRKWRGLTQQQLADAANLSRPYLTEIEKGQKDGSVRAAKAIAEALNVDIRYIVA